MLLLDLLSSGLSLPLRRIPLSDALWAFVVVQNPFNAVAAILRSVELAYLHGRNGARWCPVASSLTTYQLGASKSQLCRFRRRAKVVSPNVYAGLINAIRGETDGGAEGIRTPDPHNAIVVLYQ